MGCVLPQGSVTLSLLKVKDASRVWAHKRFRWQEECKLVQCKRGETSRRQIAPDQSVAQTNPHAIAFYKVPTNCCGFSQAADGCREQRSLPPDVWERDGKSWNQKNKRGTTSLQVVCFQWKVASQSLGWIKAALLKEGCDLARLEL